MKLYLKKGDLNKASAYFQELQQWASEFGTDWAHSFELWTKGLVAETKGNVETALEASQNVLVCGRKTNGHTT